MIGKINKPLQRLIKKKREKSQMANVRNNGGGITIDTIKKKMRAYYEQLYIHKFVNLYKRDQFLKTHKLSKHIQDEINSLNSPIIINEIKFVF